MLDPEAHAETSADHFRLPKRRIVSAAQPPASGPPVASSDLDHVLSHHHVRPRVKPARSHADFRNDELETANVTRRRIPSPQPTVLAPLRAHPGQLVNLPPPTKTTTSLPWRKVPLRAPTRPSGSPSSSSSKHLPPSPPSSNSFADLLAAAAAVEKEDARGGGVTTTAERACVCRQPPDAPCARDFGVSDPVPKASNQDGSSSLSRLLGVGKDAKVIDLDRSPMFL